MRAGSRGAGAGLFSRAGSVASVAWVFTSVVSWWFAGEAWASGAPLSVSFEASGQGLPQAEIREAIGAELSRETRVEGGQGGGNPEGVVVAVDELGQLWVKYLGPRGLVDRHLAMPAHPDQVPLAVGLSVGNLVRQEAFELLRELEQHRGQRAKPLESPASASSSSKTGPLAPVAPSAIPEPAPSLGLRAPRAAPAVPSRRNSWGHYLVGDFAYFPNMTTVCAPGSSALCYDRNFAPITYDADGSGATAGLVPANARYVMAYSRKLGANLWGSLRVGFAFSGGKGQREAAKRDSSVREFMPWLIELRLQYFVGQGVFDGSLRPFVHAAGGVAEQSAELKIRAPWRATDADGMPIAEREPITTIHRLGLLFAGAGVGLSLELLDHLRLEPELSGFVAFPSFGWFVRPSIGLTYDF